MENFMTQFNLSGLKKILNPSSGKRNVVDQITDRLSKSSIGLSSGDDTLNAVSASGMDAFDLTQNISELLSPACGMTEEEKQAMAARQAAMEEAARQRIAIQRAEAERHQDMSKYRTEKTDISGNNNPEERAQQQPRQEPVRAEKRVGRNDPCPCGSGKKYKNCHGQGL